MRIHLNNIKLNKNNKNENNNNNIIDYKLKQMREIIKYKIKTLKQIKQLDLSRYNGNKFNIGIDIKKRETDDETKGKYI